jgi:Tol biopolymer transport system component
MDADGANPIGLVTSINGDTPAWSPDGKYIAFTSIYSGGKSYIYVVDADGKNLWRLSNTDGSDDFHPVWQPMSTIKD